MALNIMIVDDSAVTRAMILKTLKMAGLPLGEVYQGANGQEGLDLLDSHWIDLAFVDINMPVMNGVQMIESMRENPSWQKLPVVVISTEGSQTRIDHINQMGAKFIHKPFSPEIVREVVGEVIEIPNA
jgi:two-component system chemotaxis response regulator CheY